MFRTLKQAFTSIFSSKTVWTAQEIEKLETQLIQADVGIKTTEKIIDLLKESKSLADFEARLSNWFTPYQKPLILASAQPFVILVIGVNGTGKTTSIGKLSYYFKNQGKTVMLAAGDTFRAAAIPQLKKWAIQQSVPLLAQSTGSDSASVIFDSIHSAKAQRIDVLIADTAGRLHTQAPLMNELKKIVRVIQKADPTAPHETLLVLDAHTGQNALQQARTFKASLPVTGLMITKLESTAKGGILFSLMEETQLPIRFIGIGEQQEDLEIFDAKKFITSILRA